MHIARVTQLREALRSGTYAQATHAMHVGTRFCIAGVACEISGLGEWVDRGVTDEVHTKDIVFAYKTGQTFPSTRTEPECVRAWFGLRDAEMAELVQLNDHGSSFADLAAILDLWLDRTRQEERGLREKHTEEQPSFFPPAEEG